MVVETFCSNKNCTTAVATETDDHLDVQNRVETEKRRISLHPFHVENENKSIGGIAFDDRKWIIDGRPRPLMSTRMGAAWLQIGSTCPYYMARME